jgi:hypothetical protein
MKSLSIGLLSGTGMALIVSGVFDLGLHPFMIVEGAAMLAVAVTTCILDIIALN